MKETGSKPMTACSKKIWLSARDRKKIQERYKVSAATVSDTLNFKVNSLLNRRMRAYAMNFLHGMIMESED